MTSIYTGISGMQADQHAVDLIANNIANANTIGFKSSTADFQETLVNTLTPAMTDTNPVQVGTGTVMSATDVNLTQGALQQSSNPLDMAMVGDGYFTVTDGTTQQFTRAGQFQLDSGQQILLGNTQEALVGWKADIYTGALDTNGPPTSNLTIPLGSTYSVQTSTCSYSGNLSAGSTTAVPTTMTVYDSLGTSHGVNVTFTPAAAAGSWTISATSPDGTVTIPPADQTVTFNSSGTLTSGQVPMSLALSAGNAAPLTVNVDLSSVTQLSGDSTAQAASQDGLPSGTLQSYSVGSDGKISGIFSNGASRVLGQIAVARFNNPAGLSQVGNTLWTMTANSGPAVIEAATKGPNVIRGGYLEQSNVDLTTEFGNLIVAQRAFQANSKTITTSDEMLQQVLQLKQ